MATDMQPFLNGLSSTADHAIADMRDRNASVTPSFSGHRFDSVLGTAQARRRESGHDQTPLRPKQAAAQTHRALQVTQNKQTDRSAQPNAAHPEEKPTAQTERPRLEKPEAADDGQNEQSSEASDRSNQSTDLTPEMLLVAGLSPLSSTDVQTRAETSSSADAAQAAEATGNGVQSELALESSARESHSAQPPSQRASAVHPGETSGQTPTDGGVSVDATAPAGPMKVSDSSMGESATPQAVLMGEVNNYDATSEISTAVTDTSPKEAQVEPDKTNVPTAVTASHLMSKPATGADADHSELQSPFDAVLRASDVSAGQGTLGAEQFLNHDQPSSSESRSGSNHPKSDLLPSDNNTLRPQFLDQATGLSPSSPPSADSRAIRGETGQAPIAHVSQSEHINELPGSFPSAQTVTLDLDPLDMGPLRVRIMMSEQTVHAHIRTEHGELGQRLLQQGQSLEASLRTTGLEMGMLWVTVDQQEQGRGEHAWAFQQQQGRPALASGRPAASGEEERASRGEQSLYNNGRVNFFA